MRHNTFHSNKSISSRGAKIAHIVGWTFLGVCIAVGFALVFGLVVKWLWNWLMPALFGLGTISYLQAFGIVLLAKLLFGSFGHRHNGHHDRFASRHDKWHKFFGAGDDTDSTPESERKFHTYYSRFWHEEGKKAFEDYIRKIETSDADNTEE
ncbi:MAG: hypothetical protein JXB23_13205 [Candidatus Aminicenantes bacterium]|nr:hypothetical protein [Candidatus Aminicenantes bacterium]